MLDRTYDPLPRPQTSKLVRQIYWLWMKNRSARGHLVAVLLGTCLALVRCRVVSWLSRRATIGIGLTEHLGDIVAAEPMSRSARQQFPERRIYWFVKRSYRQVPKQYKALDNVIAVTCLTEWLLLWSLGATDTVWDLHLNGRMCPVCGIPVTKSGAAGKIVFDNYYDLGCLLEVQSMCAGLELLNDAPVLLPDPTARRSVDAIELPARFIAIHCTSNDTSRDWLTSKWVELIHYLTLTARVHVVELGLVSRAIASDSERARSLCGSLSIIQTAEVIRRSALFVGVDSAPAQIANAVRTPGVIIMGHFHRFSTHMPYSGYYATEVGATILRADGPAAVMPLARVVEAINCRMSGVPI